MSTPDPAPAPPVQVNSLAEVRDHLAALYDRLRRLEQPQQDHVKPAEGQPADQPQQDNVKPVEQVQQDNPPLPYPQQAI